MGECTLIFHSRRIGKKELHPLRIYTDSGILLSRLEGSFTFDNTSCSVVNSSRYIKVEVTYEQKKYIIFFDLVEYLHFDKLFRLTDDEFYEYEDWKNERYSVFLRILKGVYPNFSSDDYLAIDKLFHRSRRVPEEDTQLSYVTSTIKFKNFTFFEEYIPIRNYSGKDRWVLIIEKGEERKVFNFNRRDIFSGIETKKINSEAKEFLKGVTHLPPPRMYRGKRYSLFVIRNIILQTNKDL